jgi:hypothetical protein
MTKTMTVIADGVVGRILNTTAPEETPWLWTLAFGHHEDRTPTQRLRGEGAMAAFTRSWHREAP